MSALARYARLLRPYRRQYVAGLILLALTNGLNLLVPWLVKVAVDALAREHGVAGAGPVVRGLERPTDVLVALVVVGVLLTAARTGSRLTILGAGRTLSRDLRNRLFDRVLTAPPSFFSRFPTGELMSRAIGDVGVLQSVAAPGVLYAFNALFMLAIAAPWLATVDAGLAGLVLAPFPVLAFLTWRLAERIRTATTEGQKAMAELTRAAQETLAGVEVVKAFVLEERQAERFAQANDRYLDRSLRESTLRLAVGTLSGLAGAAGTTAILWVGGRRVAEGRMSYGDLALFLTVLALVLRPVVLFGWILGLVQRGLAALDRLDEVSAGEVAAPTGGRRAPVVGEVELRELTFRFPGDAQRRPALEEVSLKVPAGKSLGLTGRIGSGKSTLLKAIPGFLEAHAGQVLVDGVAVEQWEPPALRSAIGWVPQDGYVFSMSIAENAALGRPDAPRAELEAATRTAELARDLDQLPDGLDTLVGERGVMLSGGQRQRLAIARALVVKPKVLLLDDALSMIDAATAAAILANLRRELPGTTVLVAAHRTSTLLGCDEIAVLERGRVVERGPPAELLAREGGRFRALHERQRLQADLEAA